MKVTELVHVFVQMFKISILTVNDLVNELKCTTMYFIGRVTLFFANNYLTEYRITMEF